MPTSRHCGRDWIEQQWEAARIEAGESGKGGAVLVLDEVQKIPHWSETVKRLWDDEDTHAHTALKVVILGSAPMLISQGLSESLAGRFELLHLSGEAVRQRGSSPKLQVFNTALMTAQSGHALKEAKADREYWGHLVESAVGAYLVNAAAAGDCEVFYWRETRSGGRLHHPLREHVDGAGGEERTFLGCAFWARRVR